MAHILYQQSRYLFSAAQIPFRRPRSSIVAVQPSIPARCNHPRVARLARAVTVPTSQRWEISTSCFNYYTPLALHARLVEANAASKRCPSRTTRRDIRICAARNDDATRPVDRSSFKANECLWLMDGAPKRAHTPLRALACRAPASLRSQKPNAAADETWYDCGSNTVIGKQTRAPNTALQRSGWIGAIL